jgi:hypothetical protein
LRDDLHPEVADVAGRCYAEAQQMRKANERLTVLMVQSYIDNLPQEEWAM